LGQAEILEWETDGMFLACGSMVAACLIAAEQLHEEYGLRVGVINARFIKPLDRATVLKAVEECGFVITVEEGCLMGGFGSAVLETINDAGLPSTHVRRLGLPDYYVLHAERDEQLAEVGLDVPGIIRSAVQLARELGMSLSRTAGETSDEIDSDADGDSPPQASNGQGAGLHAGAR
jgi:1-deoxy-D-xylulose-5-phosphate synthase